ncbi:MAG: hypothetical protein ABIJ20_04845 [Nanoarchaeota archaeon]|nr:hypothetical protein [Nanoarchaeota archaeon]MBU1444951.1 hypothetical protein [Nanoarchaeota archaeon]MBU2420427.1 hypothetical protein [Nanoarchaeota archaeon]MBU2475705.1 hypothetical protein [Nanoarchaeota archaeon]
MVKITDEVEILMLRKLSFDDRMTYHARKGQTGRVLGLAREVMLGVGQMSLEDECEYNWDKNILIGRDKVEEDAARAVQYALDELKKYGLPEADVKREAALFWLDSHQRLFEKDVIKRAPNFKAHLDEYLLENLTLGRVHLDIAKEYGVNISEEDSQSWIRNVAESMAYFEAYFGNEECVMDIAETHGLHQMVGKQLKRSAKAHRTGLQLKLCGSSNRGLNIQVFDLLIEQGEIRNAAQFAIKYDIMAEPHIQTYFTETMYGEIGLKRAINIAEETGMTDSLGYSTAKDIADTLAE